MLRLTVQKLGEVAVFHCSGRMTFGSQDRLLKKILRKPYPAVAVLDLAKVTRVDAAGIEMLVSVRTWTKKIGTRLKLLNLLPEIEDLLELTRLKHTFEICSVPEMFTLLCRTFEQRDLQIVDSVASALEFRDSGDVELAEVE